MQRTCGSLLGILIALVVAVEAQSSTQTKITGSGDSVSEPIKLTSGLAMIGGAYKGTGVFSIDLDGPDSSESVTLKIGAYKGVRLLPVKAASYRVTVKAAADWTVLVDQPKPDAPTNPLPLNHQAEGDSPLGPFAMKSGLAFLTFTHEGKGVVHVSIYSPTGELVDSPVLKVGAYSGKTSFRISKAGAYWVSIQADGAWTVKLEQD